MGRSFSVYLFCLALGPLFTFLNQIPGVLAVQGYVDDTTKTGDGQDLAWFEKVESCYQALLTAGFVIDPHACYWLAIREQGQCERQFPAKVVCQGVLWQVPQSVHLHVERGLAQVSSTWLPDMQGNGVADTVLWGALDLRHVFRSKKVFVFGAMEDITNDEYLARS